MRGVSFALQFYRWAQVHFKNAAGIFIFSMAVNEVWYGGQVLLKGHLGTWESAQSFEDKACVQAWEEVKSSIFAGVIS